MLNAFVKKAARYDYIFISIFTIILFFSSLIFSNKTFFFRDIHRLFAPMKYFLSVSFKSGSIPFWCPNYFCGTPFLNDIQSGVFYPFSLVFLILSFPMSLNIYVISHIFMAFCFFYRFIREIGLSGKSALLTAMSYSYGGYTLSSINTLNNLSTLIWLPAILWSFQKAINKKHFQYLYLTVIFLVMAILGGEPQLFIMMAVLLFFWGFTTASNNSSGLYPPLKNAFIVTLLIASAVLITIVQLGPTYCDYKHSIRLGGIAYGEATAFSLSWGMLKHLIFPLSFPEGFTTDPAVFTKFFPDNVIPWLLTIYPGFIIVPIVLLGIWFNFPKKMFIWLGIFFVSLLLALGSNTPVYYLFYKVFPFFRFPVKFIFLTSFSLMVMAAYCFDALNIILKQKGVHTGRVFLVLFFALTCDLYVAHRNLNPVCESEFYMYRHPYLKPVADDPDRFRIYVDQENSASHFISNTIRNNHIQWQMLLAPNLGMLHNIYHVGGTSGLELGYQYLITEMLLKPWSEKIRFLKLANVKYIISRHPLDKNLYLKGQIEKVNGLVYRILEPLPRAWIVGQLRDIKKGRIEEITDTTFEPAFTALTRGEIVSRYKTPFFKNVDKISYRNNRMIKINVTLDKPGVLFISESSYPGWRVFVDDEERELLHLNFLFQGVEIGCGAHRIDLIYRPEYFPFFLVISLGALVIFMILVILNRDRPESNRFFY